MRQNRMKAVGILLVVAVIVILVLSIWFGEKGKRELNRLSPSEVKEIFITDPVSDYTITDEESIAELLEVLKLDHLKRILFAAKKDGFRYMIDVKENNGKTVEIVVLSDRIVINHQTYSISPEYFDRINKKYSDFN